MVFELVRLLAVISVALCLIPAGAHFFELANKMSQSATDYMTTQKIYAGWSSFGVVIIAAIVFTLTHTLMVRTERMAFLLSLTAFLCLGATQVIFWTFTYPVNVATNNWTTTRKTSKRRGGNGSIHSGQRGAHLRGVGDRDPLHAHI
jgi:hypothetical protein